MNRPNVPTHGNQEDYPMVHLFFQLALELDLIRKVVFKNQSILIIYKERLSSYQKLTNSEKYVTLLETFWTKLDWKTLQKGKRSRWPSNIDILFEYFKNISSSKAFSVKEVPEIEKGIEYYDHFLFYFSYFGFWEFTIDEDISYQPDSYVSVAAKTIKLTPLLKTLIDPLIETWNPEMGAFKALDELFEIFSNHSISLPQAEEEDSPSMIVLLKPYFKQNELNYLLEY